MSRVLPIIFNAEMVQAILEGRKTVTRRVIDKDVSNCFEIDVDGTAYLYIDRATGDRYRPEDLCRYQYSDTLYVRETWAFATCIDCNRDYIRKGAPANCYDYLAVEYDDGDSISEGCFIYKAGCENAERITWRPSIHMPKAATRIWLRVKDVRVERLKEMKLNDFLQEGVVIRTEAFNDPDNAYLQARKQFIEIWDSTITRGKQDLYGWDADPWVWTVEFEQCGKPEGSL